MTPRHGEGNGTHLRRWKGAAERFGRGGRRPGRYKVQGAAPNAASGGVRDRELRPSRRRGGYRGGTRGRPQGGQRAARFAGRLTRALAAGLAHGGHRRAVPAFLSTVPRPCLALCWSRATRAAPCPGLVAKHGDPSSLCTGRHGWRRSRPRGAIAAARRRGSTQSRVPSTWLHSVLAVRGGDRPHCHVPPAVLRWLPTRSPPGGGGGSTSVLGAGRGGSGDAAHRDFVWPGWAEVGALDLNAKVCCSGAHKGPIVCK